MPERQAGRAPTGPTGGGQRRGRAGRIRRADLLRGPSLGGTAALRAALAHPATVPVVGIALGLAVVLTLLAALSWWAVRLEPGMAAPSAATARVDLRVVDEEQTARRADLRRSSAARVYVLAEDLLQRLEEQFKALPEALAAAETVEDVLPEWRERYALTPERLSAVKDQGTRPDVWQRRIENFVAALRLRPILPGEELERIELGGSGRVTLRIGSQRRAVVSEDVIDLDNEAELRRAVANIARGVGLWGETREVVVDRIVQSPVATYEYDGAATEAARGGEETVFDEFAAGAVIVARGERVTSRQVELLREERDAFLASLGAGRLAAVPLSLFLGAGALIAGLGGYLFVYYPRLVQRPWRAAAIAGLIGGGVATGVWVSVSAPRLAWLGLALAVTVPAMALVVAYGRRLGLAVGAVQVVWMGVALDLPAVSVLALGALVGVAAWRLAEIRSRADVVRATLWSSLVAALGAGLAVLVTRPPTDDALVDVMMTSFFAAIGAFAAGSLTMFFMPTIERVFDVTTGMTLGELRDPKQPLLRKLQQRAPGTYNHSLNVATIAEAAARAIGADALHLYVGCLYHDIGKLSKPEYFVENQHRGLNKHDKLSPAMSLLVIMGHVKDGLELAREYGLPRSLHHYIESHHGETLVTYFYHQARQAAEDEGAEGPMETEYRYPGPKPRTKEAAILMLCDAVEGATRAMGEPTPSRIAALVHEMAMARLHDGQFDECELTFAELSLMEDAVTKALCSIYHGRIAYPGEAKRAPSREQPETMPEDADSADNAADGERRVVRQA